MSKKEKEKDLKEEPIPNTEAEETSEAVKAPEETRPAPGPSEEEKALKEALSLAEDYKRKWYSVSAEYENYRRRTKTDCAKRYAEGRADVVSKLFPIADDLDRAIAACGDEKTKKGIEMVISAFAKILDEEKIAAIDPLGQPFDADKCEAIMAVDPADGEESGTVKEVYRKGYEQNGKVLRFAQVVVVR